ncbi:hypothetical protein [Pantoea brenneri]|nr:hypothetical protein [Pantoea brenneri]
MLCYNIMDMAMQQSGLLMSLAGRLAVAMILIALLTMAMWWGVSE